MLPLADLNQDAIDTLLRQIPGGVANIQDIYGLAPLQQGILYHHLASEGADPYVVQAPSGRTDAWRRPCCCIIFLSTTPPWSS
ncbi:hypothetical protein WR25_19284 [Diploscapter pachys]|uniref:Uncharacterized protein n=1 Tax=Diploscapter pachys TaxID=2018661 RepID=A0A2A2KBL9_9BILA|nr:hypothetical protein WR25_19284 [Diploscapter pachys]